MSPPDLSRVISSEVSIAALREYFEHAWGLFAPPDEARLAELCGGRQPRIVRVAPASPPEGAPPGRALFRTELGTPAKPAAARITWAAEETPPSDVALQHASGRCYLLQPRAGMQPRLAYEPAPHEQLQHAVADERQRQRRQLADIHRQFLRRKKCLYLHGCTSCPHRGRYQKI